MKTTGLVLLFSLLLVVVNSYKILYLLPMSSRSHRNAFDPVIYELARRNHQVTVVTSHKALQPHENLDDIIVPNIFENPSNLSKILLDSYSANVVLNFFTYKDFGQPACEVYLQNERVKNLLKRGKQFDVVIVDAVLNECALATAPLLGKNIMIHSSSNHVQWTRYFIPQPPSYVPYMILPFTSRMNFFQRLENAFTFLGTQFVHVYDYHSAIQKTIAKHLPENPLISDAYEKVALTLTNADPVIFSPRPSYPTIVDVGGIHTKEGEALPNELEDFVKAAGDEGFIVFSLGSNMQSKDIPEEMKKGILKAFSRLKQNVIWKYEEKFENLPKNVLVTKWLPQMDILAHPKLRLFITHGGLLSLQESILNGVPLVAIPLFAEQPGNVARVEEIGIGVKLEFPFITEKTMSEAINTVLTDKSFSENAKKYSAIFREYKKGKLQVAADWVEYVIRFDGAPHLRSVGENLNFFQYFLLDVAAFVLGVAGFVLVWMGRIICNKFCKCKKNVATSAKKLQ